MIKEVLPQEYGSFLIKALKLLGALFLFALSGILFISFFDFLFFNNNFLTSEIRAQGFFPFIIHYTQYIYILFGFIGFSIPFFLYSVSKKIIKKQEVNKMIFIYFILFLFLASFVFGFLNIIPSVDYGMGLGGLLGASYFLLFKKLAVLKIGYILALLIFPLVIYLFGKIFNITLQDLLDFEKKFVFHFNKANDWLMKKILKQKTVQKIVPDNILKKIEEKEIKKELAKKVEVKKIEIIKPRFQLPPYELLIEKQEKQSQMDIALIKQIQTNLENFFETFKITGKIKSYYTGPVVTLFEYKPNDGIKISKITSLSDDVARAMKIDTLRIATLSGTDSLGIELPNLHRQTVYLKSLLNNDKFKNLTYNLPVCLGVDIAGHGVYVALEKMPHLLVAGRTGAGKSVFVRDLILSLLYKLTPEQCRFILIDPKEVEFIDWKNIPHLLTPIVNDPALAINSLKWAVFEMDRRYKDMAALGVKNIEGYNEKIQSTIKAKKKLKKKIKKGIDENGDIIYETTDIELINLPYIVIIIDEFADIMMTAGKDLEALVMRLTAKARAAGIHLVLATQRPSVNIITGAIKANLPCRIAFQTISSIDSRTILDMGGAEKLLAHGDMLYMEAGKNTVRVHAPFATEKEAVLVADWWRKQGKPNYKEDVVAEASRDIITGKDLSVENANNDLFEQAKNLILKHNQPSTSFIQRHLKIGYIKAANLMDELESKGIVSSPSATGKRTILKG